VLTLVIPGLFDAMHRHECSTPELDRLVSRGRLSLTGHGDPETHIFRLACAGPDKPRVAQLSYLGDTGAPPRGICLRADPVHLHARRDQLILFAGADYLPDAIEAEELAEAARRMFAEAGFELSVPVPQRWYIQGNAVPLQSVSLWQALGQDVGALHQGEHRVYWDRLRNSVQMALHNCAVNDRRLAHDRPAVNSVWLWGDGTAESPSRIPWREVWSDEPFTRGLALHAGIRPQPAPRQYRDVAGRPGPVLAVVADMWNIQLTVGREEFDEMMASYRERWITPIFEDLNSSAIESVEVFDPWFAHLFVDNRMIRRWWVRTRPAAERMRTAPPWKSGA